VVAELPLGTETGGAHAQTGSPGARLTVLSGPSGVGKGSVVAEIRRRHPSVWLSVSVTTRQPRPGETDGVEYHFVSEEKFDQLVAASEFLEHAEFAGNHYGTLRQPVDQRLAAGLPALLEIDLQGARQVREAMPEAQFVFLAPPSWEELVRRLVGRGTEDDETIRRRLEAAQVELASEKEFDAVVVNDRVSNAARQLVALLQSPSSRPSRG
jgi:guanylate kinase